MNARATYVLIRDHQPVLYADPFGAGACALDLLDGPHALLALVEDLEPAQALGRAEGGWLLDLDRRHVLVFGQPDPPDRSVLDDETARHIDAAIEALAADRAAYVALLAPAWPGWTVEWAARGVESFSDYLAARR